MRAITSIFALLLALTNLTRTVASAPQEKSNQTADDIHYTMSRLGGTQIRFPRLTSYKDIATMNRVNTQIDELSKQFACLDPRGKDDFYKVSSRVEYAARDIFSIYATASYYCGGPYPTNDENISASFDLRTGKKVKFHELFENYAANKSQILRIAFAKQLARTDRLLAADRKRDEQDADCDEDATLFTLQNLGRSAFAYNLSEKGLVVQPQWPHVVEACAERVTVPYQQLERFAAPNSILARAMLKSQ
jgi:hypothetical protein